MKKGNVSGLGILLIAIVLIIAVWVIFQPSFLSPGAIPGVPVGCNLPSAPSPV